MSTPLSVIFEGDVTLEKGSDPTLYGYGDLRVNRKIIISGTEDSTGSNSIGSLLVEGGSLFMKNIHAKQDLNVLYGTTYLTETHIDTTNGPTTVIGGNAVNISVGAESYFTSTGGNMNVTSSTQTLKLQAGLNGNNAIDIEATNTQGGIRLLTGVSGYTSIVSGSGGLSGYTSSGNLTLTSNNASGSFAVNSVSNNQNLVLGVYGTTDSYLLLESAGIDNSLLVNTTNTAGNIKISNNNGLGNGSINVLAGNGGYSVITNTGGVINMTSQAESSSYIVESNGANQDLNIQMNGNTDSQVLIESDGNNATKPALQIRTNHTNGHIQISQPATSLGGIDILTGTNGFITSTQTGGTISMTAYGSTSYYRNATTDDNQHLYVQVTGDTNSKVIISSTGRTNDAVRIETTNGTGGVYINSVGTIQLQSTDTNNGIKIGTTNAAPVTIGTNNSVTTILGDLYVRGNTSTVDQQIVTIDDNIIVLNNAPYGTADGGIAIKRFQAANDTGVGDVVSDTADETGTVQAIGNTSLTIALEATASNVDDYYKGWWIKITTGTGAGQVRSIKSYDGTDKIATIYSTAEQTGILNSPQPIQGLDFITIPDDTSTYALFPCHYVMEIWDESNKEFAFICTSSNPSNAESSQPTIAHYSDVHLGDLQANSIQTSIINNGIADITFNVTLTDNNTTPVSLSGLTLNYGIYMVIVKPLTNTLRTHAIFTIGRVNVNTNPGQVNRIMSIKGAQNEQLMIQWNADTLPELLYRPHPNTVSSTVYKIKIISL